MSQIMGRRVWDISEFKGKSASIRIEDRSANSYGHIMVDEIEQWDARDTERATAPISVLPRRIARSSRPQGDVADCFRIGHPEAASDVRCSRGGSA